MAWCFRVTWYTSPLLTKYCTRKNISKFQISSRKTSFKCAEWLIWDLDNMPQNIPTVSRLKYLCVLTSLTVLFPKEKKEGDVSCTRRSLPTIAQLAISNYAMNFINSATEEAMKTGVRSMGFLSQPLLCQFRSRNTFIKSTVLWREMLTLWVIFGQFQTSPVFLIRV